MDAGQIVGLLGPNGAGKSTIFKIIMGVLEPSEGEVWLGEKDLTRLAPYQRARAGIGYLPQDSSVFRGLSVKENVQAVLELLESQKIQIN